MTDRHVTRRGALALVAVPVLAACSNDPQGAGRARADTPAGSPSPSPSPVWTPARAYTVLAGEVLPRCKQAGAAFLQSALAWTPGSPELPGPQLAQASAPLRADLLTLGGRHLASKVEIDYPQYGGLSDDQRSASLIVVGRQTFATSPDLATQVRPFTVDLRLSRSAQGSWKPSRVLVPRLPAPVAPTPLRTRILTKKTLQLPAAAQADIRGGLVSDRVLLTLDRLSDRWSLTVQVLRSGHPYDVFGTKRPSNHTLGRAMDIRAIDGVPVINQGQAQWRQLMRAAADLGADEIGGPADLDGKVGRRPYFTNAVHQDHVHIGFDAP